MNPRYPEVAQRATHRCEYCRAPESAFNFPFEVEHIIPRSQDGGDEETNLALACRSCNLRKSAHVNSVDPETDAEAPLFHPRRDDWNEHFDASPETCEIRGNTPTGRATVACLMMNSELQLAARQLWMRLGLFP